MLSNHMRSSDCAWSVRSLHCCLERWERAGIAQLWLKKHTWPSYGFWTTASSRAHRSLREIPSFFIMAFNVVRGTPRRVAAALTTPPVSRKTRRM